MINNKNGFGNDSHTEVYVMAPRIIDTINFDDISYRRASITNYNDIRSSSTQYNWGPTSFKLSGFTNQYLMADFTPSINLDDFCIDFWVNINNNSGRPFTDALFVGFFKATGHPEVPDFDNYCAVVIDNTYGNLYFNYISGGSTYFSAGGSVFDYDVDTWYHISAVRYNDSNLKIFINGNAVATDSIFDTNKRIVRDLDYQLLLYHRATSTTNRAFYVDVWRHSVGDYRWNRDFIIPNRYY